MNKKTYEALKNIIRVTEATVIEWSEQGLAKTGIDRDIKAVKNWIGEVAQNYREEEDRAISNKDVVRDKNGDEVEQ